MDSTSDARRTEPTPPAGGRLRSMAMIVIFDIAAPLAAYNLLRSAGVSTVAALLLSGIFPALGVAIGAIRHRRLDVIGALVLTGIAVGSVLGILSHNAKLVLVEGSVPTAVFGMACLGSVWSRRPLMFRLALEFTGPDTVRGREMTRLWQVAGYRHVLRIITAVWGAGFLFEAALKAFIAFNTSAGTALTVTTVMPFVFLAILSVWTVVYGAHHRKKGERMGFVIGDVMEPGSGRSSPRPTLKTPHDG